MSNFVLSPNMSLPVPIVGTETGPQYATDLNNSLAIIDAHTHAPGSGVQISPSAILINADLPFNNTNNATGLRSVSFAAQGSPISLPADVGCLYESGVDLYYNDGAGNQIRITQSAAVAGSAGTITGLPTGTASASYTGGSGSFIFQQATSTAANLDVGSVAIRYPGSYPTPSGNYIQLQAPTSLASGYSLTLPALPAANNTFMVMSTAGVIGTTLTVDNSTLAISGSSIIVKDLGITAAKIANATITATQIANTTITAAKIVSATITGTQLASNIDLPGNSVTENTKKLVVCSAADSTSLAITRGQVSNAGTINFGVGFSVTKNGSGDYTITFSPAFASTPAVCINVVAAGAGAYIYNITTNAAGSFRAVAGADVGFNFIAIGPRA